MAKAKVTEPKFIHLKLTHEQAEAVRRACEITGRLEMKQFDYAFTELLQTKSYYMGCPESTELRTGITALLRRLVPPEVLNRPHWGVDRWSTWDVHKAIQRWQVWERVGHLRLDAACGGPVGDVGAGKPVPEIVEYTGEHRYELDARQSARIRKLIAVDPTCDKAWKLVYSWLDWTKKRPDCGLIIIDTSGERVAVVVRGPYEPRQPWPRKTKQVKK